MKKELTFSMSVLPFIVLISAAAGAIFFWDISMHIPLLIGIIASAIMALVAGWKWNDVEEMMRKGVYQALSAVFILLIIGIIVGTWLSSGVIPTMIYYGLNMIEPSLFVPFVAIVTGIISITLGSSFTSIATIGLAFMAIGESLGFSSGLIAGAIVSGAFFGDKLSPLSDTTNIAPAMAETDLFSHIKHMLWDTIPAYVISIVLYWYIGNLNSFNQVVNMEEIDIITRSLQSVFIIHPLLLLMPIFTIFLMMKKIPAIPALTIVSLTGVILSIFVQGENVSSIIQIMANGFTIDSGVPSVDALLNKGGLMSMLETVTLLMLATALGGILEHTGAFQVITSKILSNVKTTGSLISTTIFFTFFVAFASGEQFLSIILPARTFIDKYKEMNIDTVNLSRCVEAAGTVGINLVPWGVTAVFVSNMLHVSPQEFIPFTFFAILVPLINIIFGYTGWTIKKTNVSPKNNIQTKENSLYNVFSKTREYN